MNRKDKAEIIDELSEKFSNASFFYITDASGLSVQEVNDFRRACFGRGLEYRVVKNTLIKKALDNNEFDFSEFSDKVLKGFSGVIFSPESNNLPGKVIKEFRKKGNDKPVLKGAYIDSALYYGDEQLDALSNLKSKDELIAEIIGLLQSPVKNVLGALQSGEHKLAGIVKTLSEKES